MGGRCKNPALEKYLLSNLRAETRSQRSIDPRLYNQIGELRQKLNTLMKKIEDVTESLEVYTQLKVRRLVRFEYLRTIMDSRDLQEFQPDTSKKYPKNVDPFEFEFLTWIGLLDERNEKHIAEVPKPTAAEQRIRESMPVCELVEEALKKADKKKDNEDEEWDDGGDSDDEERILETYTETNASMKNKLEMNKVKDKSRFFKMFWKNEDILQVLKSCRGKQSKEESNSKAAYFNKTY